MTFTLRELAARWVANVKSTPLAPMANFAAKKLTARKANFHVVMTAGPRLVYTQTYGETKPKQPDNGDTQ